MDALTDQEKKSLATGLAAVGSVLVPSREEYQIAELVDDNVAYAAIKISKGQWTPELAIMQVSVAVNAAASSYASLRHIQEQAVRDAIISFLHSVAQIVNARIGFDLLPIKK